MLRAAIRSVAHAVLLNQKAGGAAGERRVPRTPLVDDERDLLLRVVLVHDRRVRRDEAVHLERRLQNPGVVGFVEPHRLERRGKADHGVVVERQAIHVPAPLMALPRLHHRVGPLRPPRAIAAGPDGDLQHLVHVLLLRRIEVPDEAAVGGHLAHVVLRRHVAAAVPALVADAEIRHLIRRGMAVRRPLLRQRRRLSGGQVLQPLGGLLRRAGAKVDRDVGLAADLVDEVHELVRAEAVRLGHAAPVRVERDGSPIHRTDALAPVVLVGETAARPADVRHLQRLQRGDDVVADAARVGDRRVGADPDALRRRRGRDARRTARRCSGRSSRPPSTRRSTWQSGPQPVSARSPPYSAARTSQRVVSWHLSRIVCSKRRT